jgi:hypothetical protein
MQAGGDPTITNEQDARRSNRIQVPLGSAAQAEDTVSETESLQSGFDETKSQPISKLASKPAGFVYCEYAYCMDEFHMYAFHLSYSYFLPSLSLRSFADITHHTV